MTAKNKDKPFFVANIRSSKALSGGQEEQLKAKEPKKIRFLDRFQQSAPSPEIKAKKSQAVLQSRNDRTPTMQVSWLENFAATEEKRPS